jgi:hypothetical protein
MVLLANVTFGHELVHLQIQARLALEMVAAAAGRQAAIMEAIVQQMW